MPGYCRAVAIDPKTYPDSFVVSMETNRGRVDIKAHKDWAPNGAGQLYTLVKQNHFDDARFFRVVKGFVAQFGLSGNPERDKPWEEKCILDDPVKHPNTRGTLTFAARRDSNTRSTQLFVNLVDNPVLDTYNGDIHPSEKSSPGWMSSTRCTRATATRPQKAVRNTARKARVKIPS